MKCDEFFSNLEFRLIQEFSDPKKPTKNLSWKKFLHVVWMSCRVVCIAWLSMLLSLTANCQKLGFFSTRVFLLIFLVKKTPELIQIQDLKKFTILDDQQEHRVLCTRYDTTFRRQAKMHIRQDVVSFRVHSHLCIAFPMGLSVTSNGDHFRGWLRCGKILKTTFDKTWKIII